MKLISRLLGLANTALVFAAGLGSAQAEEMLTFHDAGKNAAWAEFMLASPFASIPITNPHSERPVLESRGVAAGLAANALTMELINSLAQSRMVRSNDVVTIIDLALVGLERTAAENPNAPPLDPAREMLERQAQLWQQGRPA